MKLYHRTPQPQQILREGFKDGVGHFGTDREWSGVWVSDIPLDSNEGAEGETLLELEIPEDVVVEYEWVQPGLRYREFLVPAAIVNKFGPPRILSSEEEGEIPDPRFRPL